MPELIEYSSGEYFRLCDQYLIGRSLECSHIIEDISISRKHCKFTVQDSQWYITDLSANGIYLNDMKIQPKKAVALKNNDCIQISNHLFGFKMQRETVTNYDNAEVICLEPDVNVIEIEDSPMPVAEAAAPCVEAPVLAGMPAVNPSTTNNSDAIDFDDELTCSICAELFINAVTLNCQHSFCELCILKWKKNSKQCPICRHAITSHISSLTINNMVSLVSSKKSQQEKDVRKETLELRVAEMKAATSPAPATRGGRGARGRRGRGRQAGARAPRGRGNAPARGRANPADADDFIDLSSDYTDSSDSDNSYLLHDWGVLESFFEHFEYFY